MTSEGFGDGDKSENQGKPHGGTEIEPLAERESAIKSASRRPVTLSTSWRKITGKSRNGSTSTMN